MGYYKNQLIASQVEEADRKPISATSHVAFPTRKLERLSRQTRRSFDVAWAWSVVTAGVMFVVGVVVGSWF